MRLNGSQILVECLKEQGVDTVFGYPGSAVLNIYDELYRHQGEIRHVLTCHEQGAAHAADGYARATGKVGVCMATSGPGATNLVTGIATAYMDSVPLVAITGQVSTNLLGKDSFQEVDIAGITMPVTKHSYIVKDVHDLADTIRKAFVIAKSGRPGPVLVDICKDVTVDVCDYSKTDGTALLPRFRKQPLNQMELKKAVRLLQKAKRPILLAGGGVIQANGAEALKQLAVKADLPVCSTMMGIGCFDSADPRFLGMAGMHGSKAANTALCRADVILAVGTRFSDRLTGDTEAFGEKTKIIHIDNDPAEIGKNIPVSSYLLGDMTEILLTLVKGIGQLHHDGWLREVVSGKDNSLNSARLIGALKPEYIVRKVDEATNGEAIVVTEVGQHQIWAAQFFRYRRPRTFLTSGGLGTMGYGLGAAIGAQIALPEKRVVNFAGDGSFAMNLSELMTAKTYNVPVIEIVFNNHVLGMVRQWQDLFYEKRFSQTTLSRTLDFVKLGEAMGIQAFSVSTTQEFDEALSWALGHRELVLIGCEIEADEMAFPIVPPGKPIDQQIDNHNL